MIILHTGVEIIRESSSDLMDTLPGKHLATQIKELVTSISGVLTLEEIHAH
ncbi:MAG: hypothetical protein R2861_14745 [Desulfobacterales bacterium]